MDRVYLNELFDIYENILSDHEKEVFKDYYQDDLSLQEIADNNNVTRNAIHKTLKNVEDKLKDIEEKLNFYKKRIKILKAIDNNDLNKIKEIIE